MSEAKEIAVKLYVEKKPKHVLIVEDETAYHKLLKEWISHNFGCSTESAFTGGEALEKLLTGTFDAILLNINLPEMRGDEVLRQAAHRVKGVPVIVITGYDGDRVGQMVKDLGVVTILKKQETSAKEFCDCMRKFLSASVETLK